MAVHESKGIPFAGDDLMPKWCRSYFTKSQRTSLDPMFRWIVLVRKSAISKHAYAVAITLWTYARGADSAWPSQETLCSDTKLGRTSVQQALYELQRQGWLEIHEMRESRSGWRKNKYLLCWPAEDVIQLEGQKVSSKKKR